MQRDAWAGLAQRQEGMLARWQLHELGVDRWAVAHRVRSGRWSQHTPTVFSTTTGELTRAQTRWLGVLHAGGRGMVAGLSAAELQGLRQWQRDKVTVLVGKNADVGAGHPMIDYVRTRRDLASLRVEGGGGPPVCRLEPAVLLFASRQRSARTAEGVLAAVVQQRLTTPQALMEWLNRLTPLRGAARFRRSLSEISGGAQSVAEIDVRRLCRDQGLASPRRQVRRRDASGRLRYTDCEWRSLNGGIIVLEVDGAFHMDVEHWEEDLARQRALSGAGRVIVRCTARELRDCPAALARDLRDVGVPPAVGGVRVTHRPLSPHQLL